MNILYTSNFCSNKEFERIYDMCGIKPLQSIQKFNVLLGNGLVENEGINLDVVTSAPVNFKMCKKLFWKSKIEKENNINYNYCFMINFPIIKHITLFFSSIIAIKKWYKKVKNDKDNIIIYDAYCPIISNVATAIGKKHNIDVIALYTDVPKCMGSNLNKQKAIKKIFNKIYNYMDDKSNKTAKGYILLTEQMNEVVNVNTKPYIVIEGFVDKNFNVKNGIEDKYNKFTLMYAGGLYEKYGIKMLIDAVKEIDNNEIQLLLFGEGELVQKLKEDKNPKIVFGGSLLNYQIVKEEAKSTVLVNPRFTNEEYTKYSFPSKNMEYMVSGTPTLTTCLPGMPKEYFEHIYLIEEETVEGVKRAIENLIKIDREKLHQKGLNAQKFVLENKNNYIQAKKIIDFMKKR